MTQRNLKKIFFLLMILFIGINSNAQTNKGLPQKGQHYISLNEAINMTSLYRQKKVSNQIQEQRGKTLPPLSETFEASDLLAFLSRPGVKALRFYYGMSSDLQLHVLLVGVNENNEDILEGSEAIMERGVICPPTCPNNNSVLTQ
ncbi:MAG: hypothetical protein WKF85_14370 [Chitinophagaceae bacterium]